MKKAVLAAAVCLLAGFVYVDHLQAAEDEEDIATTFSRYDENDKKISTYNSLYIVTKSNGHWGTQARSSFAP